MHHFLSQDGLLVGRVNIFKGFDRLADESTSLFREEPRYCEMDQSDAKQNGTR